MNRATLTTRQLQLLSLITLLVVLPHFTRLDPTVSIGFSLVVLLRLGSLEWPRLLPGRWLLLPITLAGSALVFTRYPLFIGLEAKIALLSLMLGLKLMECRQPRDLYVVSYLGLFTLTTHFLFSQEMLTVAYVILMVIGLSALLILNSRADPASGGFSKALGYASLMLLQALPVMLALFFLFPRIDGPLWNLGVDNRTGSTGLSDSMSPGSISQLIRSRAVAFRVEFEQQSLPPSPLRYWRGPVLWHSDGRRWTRGTLPVEGPVTYQSGSRPVSYQVTLEPSANNWLYALDLPEQLPPGATLSPDFQITARAIENRRYRYQASSRLDYNTGPLSDRQRNLGLQLPDNITPRMRALVDVWRRESASDPELVKRALRYFRNQPFYYTLNPPLLERNPTDQFLFDSRRGFCEHYATSFTLLMRLAGIPARVVTGYQGGEVNPLGDYLIVRQSDAHAWSEVWLEGAGWRRVDPTAAVAPERIEAPFEFNLQENDLPGMPVNFNLGDQGLLRELFKQLRFGIDASNASWHRWVLGYSHQQQQQLMQLLGLGNPSAMALALGMVLAVAGLLTLLILLLRRRGRRRLDPVQADYLRFCRRLAGKGLVRLPHEGPRDFARRVMAQRPDLSRAVGAITAHYIALRYGTEKDPRQRQRLHRLVRQFRA